MRPPYGKIARYQLELKLVGAKPKYVHFLF